MNDEDLKQALQDYLEKDEETTVDLVNTLSHLQDYKQRLEYSFGKLKHQLYQGHPYLSGARQHEGLYNLSVYKNVAEQLNQFKNNEVIPTLDNDIETLERTIEKERIGSKQRLRERLAEIFVELDDNKVYQLAARKNTRPQTQMQKRLEARETELKLAEAKRKIAAEVKASLEVELRDQIEAEALLKIADCREKMAAEFKAKHDELIKGIPPCLSEKWRLIKKRRIEASKTLRKLPIYQQGVEQKIEESSPGYFEWPTILDILEMPLDQKIRFEDFDQRETKANRDMHFSSIQVQLTNGVSSPFLGWKGEITLKTWKPIFNMTKLQKAEEAQLIKKYQSFYNGFILKKEDGSQVSIVGHLDEKQSSEDVVLDYGEQIIGVYGLTKVENPKRIITAIGVIVWKPDI